MSKMGAMPIVIEKKKIKKSEREKYAHPVLQTFQQLCIYIFIDVIMSNYVQLLFHLGSAKQFIYSPWSEEK